MHRLKEEQHLLNNSLTTKEDLILRRLHNKCLQKNEA